MHLIACLTAFLWIWDGHAQSTDVVALEPLVTPVFLKELNPIILTSLSKTLSQMDLPIPPQSIPYPIGRPIALNVTKFDVVTLNWRQGAGLFFGNDYIGFKGVLDSTLQADYSTDSKLRLPSGHLDAAIQGCRIDAGLAFDYNPSKKILEPQFKIKLVDSCLLSFATKVLRPVIRKQVASLISWQLKLLMPSVMESVSQTEFEIPYSGIYHTEFTQAPWITPWGALFDMALYRGGISSTGHVPVVLKEQPNQINNRRNAPRRRIKRRDNEDVGSLEKLRFGSSFSRTMPSPRTALQPLLTPALISELNPILLTSASIGLSLLNIQTSQKIDIPLTGPLEINVTTLNFRDVTWAENSGLYFGDGFLNVDATMSSHIFINYTSNSRVFVPSGTLDIDISKCRLIAAMGFKYGNDTLYPFFNSVNVTFDRIDIKSSSMHTVNALAYVLNPIIRSKASTAIAYNFKHLLPGVLTDILQTEIEVPLMGPFHSQFLTAPTISDDGMLVDMNFVPGRKTHENSKRSQIGSFEDEEEALNAIIQITHE